MAIANALNAQTAGIQGMSSAGVWTGTAATNHALIVGGATASTLTNVGPTATAGQVLQSAGSSADPVFSTATYPATTTINQILYSSSNNVINQITAANNGTLISGATGIPSLLANGTTGQVLTATTGSPPSWVTPSVVPIAANTIAGSVINLGITYSASTFTVRGANASLSASNIAYVSLNSQASPGTVVTIAVTANQTFIDDSGSSTIVGNLFGFGSGDSFAVDCPFYIYAVLNDAENAISFMISRTPGMTLSPVTANIGQSGTANADVAYGMFALGSITITDYDENPCVCIGAFRMRLTTTGGDWTVQALGNQDGIGNFLEDVTFTFPPAVMGAATNSYFQANGGTAPAWSTASRYEYFYRLTKNGRLWACLNIDGDPSTDGVGAVTARIIMPFQIIATKSTTIGTGDMTLITPFITNLKATAAVDYFTVFRVNDLAAGLLANSEITAAGFVALEYQLNYAIRTV